MAAEERNPIGSTTEHAGAAGGHGGGGGGAERNGGSHGGGGHGGGGHSGGGGHGQSGGHEEAHEGAPEWIISFADNTALVMGFFAILLAMTMAKVASQSSASAAGGPSSSTQPAVATDNDAMLDWVIAVRSAFNNPVRADSNDPAETALVRRMIQRGAVQDRGPRGRDEKVQSLHRSDFYSPSGSIQFAQDSSDLTPSGRETLTQLAILLRGKRLIVEIRGHASAMESALDPGKGVRLSFDRAVATGDFLVASGLTWRQLRVVAAGDNQRVVPRAYDPADNEINSRAEIFVTDEVMPDY